MTANQLRYWELQEAKRKNLESEDLERSKQNIARSEVPAKYINSIFTPIARLIPGLGSLLRGSGRRAK